jgi:anti-sigma factor ChrR (cupin superfamily)
MFPIHESDNVPWRFPANALDFMPKMDEIPEEFNDPRNKWVKFQMDWFYRGLKDLKIVPKEGVDTVKAMRHLSAIQGSFAPKHEHKEAAVAYLASQWFEDVSYTRAK